METSKKTTKRLFNFFFLDTDKIKFYDESSHMTFINTRKLEEQRNIEKEVLLEQSTSL